MLVRGNSFMNSSICRSWRDKLVDNDVSRGQTFMFIVSVCMVWQLHLKNVKSTDLWYFFFKLIQHKKFWTAEQVIMQAKRTTSSIFSVFSKWMQYMFCGPQDEPQDYQGYYSAPEPSSSTTYSYNTNSFNRMGAMLYPMADVHKDTFI